MQKNGKNQVYGYAVSATFPLAFTYVADRLYLTDTAHNMNIPRKSLN